MLGYLGLLMSIGLAMAGCMTGRSLSEKGRLLDAYNEPLDGWDRELIEKYTRREGPEGTNGQQPLQFVLDFEERIKELQGSEEVLQAADDMRSTSRLYTGAKSEAAESELKAKAVAEKVAGLREALLKAKAGSPQETDVRTRLVEAEAELGQATSSATAAKASVEGHRIQYEAAKDRYEKPFRVERNEIIDELIILGKAYHELKDDSHYYSRATVNSYFDAVQLVATGIASVAGSEGTVRALAALATGTQGLQESVDRRFYYELTTPILLSKMNEMRNQAEKTLLEKTVLSIEEYPLQAALDDFITFYLAGGLTDALRELGRDAAQKETATLKALEELRGKRDENLQRLIKEREAKELEQVEIESLKRQMELELLKRGVRAVTGSGDEGSTPGA